MNFLYCRKPFLQHFTDSAIYHFLLPNSFPIVTQYVPIGASKGYLLGNPFGSPEAGRKISQVCSNLKETIDRSGDVGDKKQKS